MEVNKFPDRIITIQGTPYLYFGGTSYLGMATNTTFTSILSNEIKKWGSFYGSSRNSNIKLSIYNEFEAYFSDMIDAESTVCVSSGTLAGKLVIEHLYSNENIFFQYPKTHPAILEKNSLPLFLNNTLHPKIKESKHIVITLDAVLGGEITETKLDFLDEIPKETNLTLVIDESHSLGILGSNGNGIYATINHPKITRKIMVSSLGKALGLSGGVIASDTAFINKIKQHPMFVSSSGMNPAYLATFLKSEEIYKLQKEKLHTNLAFLDKKLNTGKLSFNKKYPIIYLEDEDVYDYLFNQGIVITSFKYPTYKKRMNRIVITANHTINDLEKLVLSLKRRDSSIAISS